MSVLVDSSAWVDFFRGERPARDRLGPLLDSNSAAVCAPVFAEVVSGARDRRQYDHLSALLRLIGWLEPAPSVWERAAEVRFGLARQGFQAGLVDLVIAITALESGASLLTRDRDFVPISRALSLDVDLF